MEFTYNLSLPLTKSYLLERNTEEQYMSYYLQHPVNTKIFRSPLRKDKNPTCGFYRNKGGDLIFHDFATGQHLNFIGVVQELYHLTYHQALKQIAKDFGIIKSNNSIPIKHLSTSSIKFENKGPANIRVKIKEFTSKELAWWKTFGITYKTLKKFHVYSCDNVFLNDNLFTHKSTLTFGYYGGKLGGKELWRIYYSQRKEFRFLTNWPSKKIQGFSELPKYGNLLVITKSMKDVMAMYEFGITACAPNSETQSISDSVLQQLKERFKIIVYMYDNDYAGIVNMNKIKKQHPELNYFFIPRFGYAKDFTDLVKQVGIKQMKNYILQVVRYYSNKWKQNKEFKYGIKS